jgi:signal transduction histidine kinase
LDHNLDFVKILGARGMVHPEDRVRAQEAFARALHGARPETVKLRYLEKGGSWRTMLASTQSYLADPAVRAVVVQTRDVTEQCAAEASLLLANSRVAALTEQLTTVAERQRKFLAAELHDDVQQILFGLRMSMAPSRNNLPDQLPKDLVEGWIHTVQTAIDHLHELTVVLRKPVIDSQGLPGALRSYLDKLPLAPDQKVRFETDAKVGALAPNVALACFRIVQEALANAVRHSRARNLLVRLKSSHDRLTVSIRDDGVGFDVKDACAHAVDAGSIGLSSMRERAALAGGRFEVKSSIGHGTRIRASFPIVGSALSDNLGISLSAMRHDSARERTARAGDGRR